MIIMFLIFVMILLLILLVFPIFIKEIIGLFEDLPDIFDSFLIWVNNLALEFGFEIKKDSTATIEMLFEQFSSKPVTSFFKAVFKQTFSLLSLIANFLIFAVLAFFISYKLPVILGKIEELFPRTHKDEILSWMSRFDRILSGFFRGQITVGFLLGSFYAVGLTIAGLENGGSIGAMVGLFCLVPYVGLFVGFVIAVLLGLIKGGVFLLIKIVIVFVIIQTIDTIFITPNIMGKKVGISPVFVIIALFAGAELGGFLGVLIAVPVFAILKIISEEIIKKYKESDFYKA